MENRVTLCTVVYNELPRLRLWLDHHSFFSDIVVIDQSSSDGTPEVLKSEYPEVQLFQTPRFGYFEIDKNMMQLLSATVFSLDVDEFWDQRMNEPLGRVLDEFNAQGFSVFYLRRRNFINGQDMSQRFGTPVDPEGRDWQGRITYGPRLQYQRLLAHPAPVNSAKFLYLNPDRFWIDHRRSFDDIMKANLYRIRGCSDQQVVREHISFIQKVAQALNLSSEEFNQAREKYE